jgi:hypothetical protein
MPPHMCHNEQQPNLIKCAGCTLEHVLGHFTLHIVAGEMQGWAQQPRPVCSTRCGVHART